VFAAFCLNMRELDKNPNYIIKTPVFLDATCSGIQHLAALMKDLELGCHVNLLPNLEKDEPNDIYSVLVDPINKAINKYGEENLEYSSLSLVKFNRKILKESIMTKLYNVTQFGITEQLKSKLKIIKYDGLNSVNKVEKQIRVNLKNSNFNSYIAPGKLGDVILTKSDLFKIASIINEQIFVVFPSLNNIYSYFINMAKIMIKLNIPIT
jgi:DNA-directed RNA polymerase